MPTIIFTVRGRDGPQGQFKTHPLATVARPGNNFHSAPRGSKYPNGDNQQVTPATSRGKLTLTASTVRTVRNQSFRLARNWVG